MRKQKLVLSPTQWRDRCRQLAEDRHLTGTARFHGEGAGSRELYSTSSVGRDGRRHVIRHYLNSGEMACDCVAGSYGQPCAHVGAVLHFLDMRARALLEAAEAMASEQWRYWLNGGEWV